MEKCIVLHNMVCYKYVYFLAHDITRWKKKNAGKVIVDIILPGDGGMESMTQEEEKKICYQLQ